MRLADALARGPVLLDGGLATTLEARGADLSSSLWSARLLLDDPAAIEAVHLAFLVAGAQVCTTASYQVSAVGFASAGRPAADAREAITRSVAVARAAIGRWRASAGSDEPRWVAGSVGPYGAVLADGSEYTGAYDLTDAETRAFHAPRVELLARAGADILAIETQPRLDEALVVLALAAEAGVPAWVSFTTADGQTLPDGTPVAAALASARDAGALAVGVNCCPPAAAARALAAVPPAVFSVAYPNLGDRWDPVARTWERRADGDATDLEVLRADLIGGCCGTSPADIARLRTVRGGGA